MHKIKQIPEDFIVKEITKLNFNNNGKYSYYLLKKKNYTTIDAINLISKKLKLKTKYINFAGTKDKKAVTEQYISILNRQKRKFKKKDIELKFLGKGNDRLNLGNLEGNDFIITVRNLKKDEVDLFKKNLKKNIKKIPNYFDKQRFGINKNNHIIGKHIIKKKFKEACKLIPEVKDYLNEKPNDFIGALRSLNKRILRIYIHAYQSYLFNETVNQYLKLKKTNKKIPIIGFGTETKIKTLKNIINKIMKKENISFHDFIIRQIPELTSEGSERDLFVNIKNFKIESIDNDELNKQKNKVKLKFTLEKGSYATNVIKFLFKP